MAKRLVPLLSVLMLAACGGAVKSEEAGTPPASRPAGVLDVSSTDAETRGTFTRGDDVVTFRSKTVDGIVDLQATVNGLTLDALMDPSNGVSSMDGFAASNGADTQIVDEDRALLTDLYHALNERFPSNPLPDSLHYLRRAVGLWAEHPTTVDLKRTVMGEEGRGYTMLCSYAKCNGNWTGSCGGVYNWFSYAKHDCNHGGFDVVYNQQVAQLGDHYTCNGDEYYSTNGGASWTCGEPDHWNRPKVTANCFGRCGPGCGGDTQYTVDATNHDGCVRNGHALASAYCDDQFTACSDDELFAPNCY